LIFKWRLTKRSKWLWNMNESNNMVNVTFVVLFILYFLASYKWYWIGFSVKYFNLKHVYGFSLYLWFIKGSQVLKVWWKNLCFFFLFVVKLLHLRDFNFFGLITECESESCIWLAKKIRVWTIWEAKDRINLKFLLITKPQHNFYLLIKVV